MERRGTFASLRDAVTAAAAERVDTRTRLARRYLLGDAVELAIGDDADPAGAIRDRLRELPPGGILFLTVREGPWTPIAFLDLVRRSAQGAGLWLELECLERGRGEFFVVLRKS